MSGQSRGKCNLRRNYVWAESWQDATQTNVGMICWSLDQFHLSLANLFLLSTFPVSQSRRILWWAAVWWQWPTVSWWAPCRHLSVIIDPGSDGGSLPVNISRRDPGLPSPDLGGVWWHSDHHGENAARLRHGAPSVTFWATLARALPGLSWSFQRSTSSSDVTRGTQWHLDHRPLRTLMLNVPI